MNKRLFTLTLFLLLLVLVITGCTKDLEPIKTEIPQISAEPTTVPPSQEIVNEVDESGDIIITDVIGNQLTLPKEKPTRIISLTPSNTEMLFALGLGEFVVGVDDYSNYPEAALNIAKVGDFYNPNIEAILILEPDLVLAGNKLQVDTVTRLKEVGLNVAAVEATRYEEVIKSIKLVGDLTLTSDKAQEIIDNMILSEEAVIEKIKNQSEIQKTVYFVLSAGEAGNWTSGPGSLINDMFELLGVRAITNIKGGVEWMDFSIETLIIEDPDIMFMSAHSNISLEELALLDGYKDLTAIKEGKVFVVDADITGRASVRIVEALEIMYNIIYPS